MELEPIMLRSAMRNIRKHELPNGETHPVIRVIGIELRLKNQYSGMGVEELAIIPVQFEYPRDFQSYWMMPCTVHTSVGDRGFTIELPR